MTPAMRISHFQIGNPRSRQEQPRALRVSTTRYPPRGVPIKERTGFGKYDVWFPLLAPSARLLRNYSRLEFTPARHKRFITRYTNELMASAEKRGALDLLVAVSKRVPVAVGCYCNDPKCCHRSVLASLLRQLRQPAKRSRSKPRPKIIAPAPLSLVLRKQWFDLIARREKKIEYRERTPYWESRLEGKRFKTILFRNGYATKAPEMLVEYKGLRRYGRRGRGKYAIRLGRVLRITRWKG